jgi:uncharacterized protein (UPF0332 family)
VNAAEFISLAKEMLHERPTASRCRSIISRAYYGAFHAATNLIADIGLPAGHNHGHLQHDYLNSGSVIARDIGLSLEALHSLRIQADYRLDLKHVETPEVSLRAVTRAETTATWINDLQNEFEANPAAKEGFLNAITEFRRKVNRRS